MSSMPSFVGRAEAVLQNRHIENHFGLSTIKLDISFGGMWYAIVDADAIGLGMFGYLTTVTSPFMALPITWQYY